MKKILWALPLALAAMPAHAANFLDGDYGDKSGCVYSKTGNTSDDGNFFVINNDGITTADATCDFDGDATKTATGFTIKAQCDADGEASKVGNVTLTQSPKGYAISLPDGTKFGPYAKCK